MPEENKIHMKAWCYLVCLLALLLSISDAYVCRVGLFILLFLAPFAAVRRLRPKDKGPAASGLLWLLLALGWAVGVLSGEGLAGAASFCLSLLSWLIYLCRNACAGQNKTWREVCVIAFMAVFYDPWAFFLPEPTSQEGSRKSRAAEWTYKLYILSAVLILLVFLLIQADHRIEMILRVCIGFGLEKAPFIISCLVLALFPASFIYSFLSKLEDVSKSYSGAARPVAEEGPFAALPWGWLCILLTAVNCFFLLVETYYCMVLKNNLPLQDNLYDVLAVIVMILIGLGAIFYQISIPKGSGKRQLTALAVSVAALILFVGGRLFAYIMRYGLWEERAVLSVILLFFVLLLLCMLGFGNQNSRWFLVRTGAAIAIFLMVLNILPHEIVLTQSNAAIFLYKYRTQQLEGQSGMQTEGLVELSENDLRLDLMESYGISGVPALTRLVDVADVTIDGQILGARAENAILDCFCRDLQLTRTGDNQTDVNAILVAAGNIPHYRLSESYRRAFRLLREMESGS